MLSEALITAVIFSGFPKGETGKEGAWAPSELLCHGEPAKAQSLCMTSAVLTATCSASSPDYAAHPLHLSSSQPKHLKGNRLCQCCMNNTACFLVSVPASWVCFGVSERLKVLLITNDVHCLMWGCNIPVQIRCTAASSLPCVCGKPNLDTCLSTGGSESKAQTPE